jgi:protein-S-isoprenylcysteine O-methyltransferase Ste14
MIDRALASVHRAFNDESARRLWRRWRIVIAFALALIPVFGAKPEWFRLGLAISVAGALLQLWCFACIHKRKALAIDGPYKIVRNPMYLARFLLVLGLVVMLGDLRLIPVYVTLYWFYMVNRVQREESTLREVFGAAYADYCACVHRFLPLGWYPAGRLLSFSPRCLVRNHGHLNALAIGALYVGAYLATFGWTS